VPKPTQKLSSLRKADLHVKQSVFASPAMFAVNALSMPSPTMSALVFGADFLSVSAVALSAVQHKFQRTSPKQAALSIGSFNGR
jgi:hypothetical protein